MLCYTNGTDKNEKNVRGFFDWHCIMLVLQLRWLGQSYMSESSSNVHPCDLLFLMLYGVSEQLWSQTVHHAIYSLALKHVGLQICARWYWKSQLHRPTMCCLLLCCFTLQHYRHTSVYCCFSDATKALIELNTLKFSNVYETCGIILLS